MQLNIETEIDGDTLNLTLSGEFDMGSVPAFRSTVEGEQPPWRRIVIELGDVGFMDSSGLQELVRVNNRARELGREMVLAQPSQPVRRLLELTGLDTQFTVSD